MRPLDIHHDTPFPSTWNAYSPKRSYCQLLSFGQVADPLVTNLRWCTSQYPSACGHQCSALARGWCDDSKCSALVLLSQVCTCTFVGQVGIVQSLQHPQMFQFCHVVCHDWDADGCLKFAGYFKNWVGRNSWVLSGWLELHTKLFQPIQVVNEVMLGLGPALLQNLKIVSSLSWAFAFFLQHCFELISIFEVFLHQVPLSTQGPTGLRPVQTWNLSNFKVCSLFLQMDYDHWIIAHQRSFQRVFRILFGKLIALFDYSCHCLQSFLCFNLNNQTSFYLWQDQNDMTPLRPAVDQSLEEVWWRGCCVVGILVSLHSVDDVGQESKE